MINDTSLDGPRQARTIQSVDRALTLLHVLATEHEGVRLRDLAARLSLAPQTVQSLLRTLEAWEMVVQPERGGPYALGPAALLLGQRWLAADGHAALARPQVEALSRDVEEYVLLAELRGAHLYRLIECHGTQPLTVRPELVPSRRLYVMATGRVLLAWLPAPELEHALRDHHAAAEPPPETLPQLLADVRRQGYAVCVDENGPHVSAVAVPVHVAGRVHAALGISLPSVRLTPTRQDELLAALRRTARAIEQAW